MILQVSHLTKSFADVTIIRDAGFFVEDREKVALNGNNGAGKTTIFRMITGEYTPDSGEVFLKKDCSVGYLRQEQNLISERTIYEEVLSVREDVFLLEQKLRETEKAIAESTDDPAPLYRQYERLSHSYEQQNGYAAKSEVLGILKGLGFTESTFDTPVSTLSGGEKTRVALSKLLLGKPDLLLLDEPTNHLDLRSVSWLENYLLTYPGAVLLTSHDRYFLDKVVTKIVDVEFGTTRTFLGNYSAFVEKKAQEKAAQEKAYEAQQKMIAHERKVIDTLMSYHREKSILRAQSREKRLSHVELLEKPKTEKDDISLSFRQEKESGSDVLSVDSLSKSFGEKALFSDVSFTLKRGERLTVIGDNGTGKTTLIRILIGETAPDGGTISYGTNVSIGYYDQQHESLSLEKTVFDDFHDEYPEMTNTEVRTVLGSFLFHGDEVFQTVASLSGGEKSRLALAKLMQSKANLLILDEPTNHLDIAGKEALESALRAYPGTVISVSHDRYYVNGVSTKVLEIYDNKAFLYQGNYDYYLEKRDLFHERSANASSEVSAFSSVKSERPAVSAEKAKYESRKEALAVERRNEARKARLEQKIDELSAAVEETDRALSDPENVTKSDVLMELTAKKQELEDALSEVYAEWEAMIDKNG